MVLVLFGMISSFNAGSRKAGRSYTTTSSMPSSNSGRPYSAFTYPFQGVPVLSVIYFIFFVLKGRSMYNTTNFVSGHLTISNLWTQMFNIWCHCVFLCQVLKVQLVVQALTLQILMLLLLLLLLLELISAFQVLESTFYCLQGWCAQ